jgi:cytochrome c biogenesis protein ResB
MLKKLWRFCGDVKVNFALLLLISSNLVIGSFYVSWSPQIFKPLNNFLLQDWLRLYGNKYPDKIWWLWTMLGLLVALGLNTGICALDRITNLLAKRKQMTIKIFFLKITPSIIHICFLVILVGHLTSMISGFNKVMLITTEIDSTLPIKANLVDRHCDYYSSPELLEGYAKQCTVSLKLQSPVEAEMKQVSFLHPFSYHGFTFHLTMDKKAKNSILQISVKHDPGLKLILAGFIALVLLMLWYFPQLNKNTKGG